MRAPQQVCFFPRIFEANNGSVVEGAPLLEHSAVVLFLVGSVIFIVGSAIDLLVILRTERTLSHSSSAAKESTPLASAQGYGAAHADSQPPRLAAAP